jgi:hypothetical protein
MRASGIRSATGCGATARARIPRTRRSEALVQKVIEPLIPVELFDAAQRELNRRKESWGRSKRPRRFLAAGLLSCGCGRKWYLRGAAVGTRKKEYYFCSSGFSPRHGPACGARSYQREAIDQAITETLE